MNDELRYYNNNNITTKLHDERSIHFISRSLVPKWEAIIGFKLNVSNTLILSEVGNTIDTCMVYVGV